MSHNLFYEELVFLDCIFKNQRDFFAAICQELYSSGWVKESFEEAIVQREQSFSTGLETLPYSVAIPHTDAEHVQKNFIAFIRVQEPVSFVHMGIPDKTVEAHMMFMLGIADPSNQVKILSNMIELLSDEATMRELMVETDKQKIVDRMNQAVVL